MTVEACWTGRNGCCLELSSSGMWLGEENIEIIDKHVIVTMATDKKLSNNLNLVTMDNHIGGLKFL